MIEQWHTPEGTAKHNAALARLLQLRVLEAAPIPHSTDLGYALHQTLARHLRIAVYGGCDRVLLGLESPPSLPYDPTNADLTSLS